MCEVDEARPGQVEVGECRVHYEAFNVSLMDGCRCAVLLVLPGSLMQLHTAGATLFAAPLQMHHRRLITKTALYNVAGSSDLSRQHNFLSGVTATTKYSSIKWTRCACTLQPSLFIVAPRGW